MPELRHISLRNFRGARNVRIDINNKTKNRIITLIGLNESGKTTVLEGLALYPINDVAAASVFKTADVTTLATSYVPIHRTGVFTGDVRSEATITLNDADWTAIVDIAKKRGLEIDSTRKITDITVSKTYSFKDGDYVPSKFGSYWDGVELYVRSSKRSSFKLSELPELGDKDRDSSLWMTVVNHLRSTLPHVVYFPNFIVEIPRKIYIAKFDGETTTNSYFRRIIEHILEESEQGLSLQTHVLDRVAKYRGKDSSNGWITKLLTSSDKDKIDAVFARLSSIMTEEVLGLWSKVFNRSVTANRVEINWFVDPDNDQPFIEVKISDGRSAYHLHQRSLGFRWFFTFLLFTQFGRDRERPNLFLFDEPAANLHARAQGELLASFQKLADAGDLVIYSTHSHHMIKPEWLSGAYIVENDAIDYDGEDPISTGQKDTNIRVTPYRRFVGEHGNRISYYQPVLERLQYSEPSIVPGAAQVLVEGATDFYAFSYALRRSRWDRKMMLVPGTGSGSLDTLISIALARGHRFVVLLDDDKAGKKAAERYRSLFHLREDNVFTLGRFGTQFDGKSLEGLLSAETRAKVAEAYGNHSKKSIGNYLAEIAATNLDGGLDGQTLEDISAILDKLAINLELADEDRDPSAPRPNP